MIRRLIGLIVMVGVIGADVGLARAQDETSWFLNEINNLRASVGLPPYTLNPQLTAAATRQSQYLAETCNITHTWPDGTTPADRARQAGYAGDWISENIYAGANARPIDAWTFWLNSPIHYNGLVHDTLTEIGIGIVHGGYCGHAYTLVFGLAGGGSAPPPSSGNGAAESALAAAPQVYVPPPPTHTPTATIPTLTPSATWTITPTYTPTTTGLPPTATGTPLVLPTVPALNQRASDTPTPGPSDSRERDSESDTGQVVAVVDSPVPPVSPTDTPQGVMRVPVAAAADRVTGGESGGFGVRDLVPVALAVQIVLIGAVGFWYFRRKS